MLEWLNQPVEAIWLAVALPLLPIAWFTGRCLVLWHDCRRLDREIDAYNEHWREMWS